MLIISFLSSQLYPYAPFTKTFFLQIISQNITPVSHTEE